MFILFTRVPSLEQKSLELVVVDRRVVKKCIRVSEEEEKISRGVGARSEGSYIF